MSCYHLTAIKRISRSAGQGSPVILGSVQVQLGVQSYGSQLWLRIACGEVPQGRATEGSRRKGAFTNQATYEVSRHVTVCRIALLLTTTGDNSGFSPASISLQSKTYSDKVLTGRVKASRTLAGLGVFWRVEWTGKWNMHPFKDRIWPRPRKTHGAVTIMHESISKYCVTTVWSSPLMTTLDLLIIQDGNNCRINRGLKAPSPS